MYIDGKTQAYAEGYHDGRMEYDFYNQFIDQSLRDAYAIGYENGLEDRTEQDERN